MFSISIGSLSLPLDRLLVLVSFGLAMLVGYIVGRQHKQSADGKIATIFIIAMVVARVVFVIQYWDEYRTDLWSMIDIRDAGFNGWAGLMTVIALTAITYWRQPKIRKALVSGIGAGALLWGVASGALWMIKDTSQKLPTLVVTDLNDDSVELNTIEAGKPRVINLWATWCPPCRREMPVLQQAQKDYTNVGIVFVNQGEHRAVIEQFMAKESLQLRNMVMDSKAMLGQLAGSRALPTTLFINGKGQIVDAHLGELSSATLASKLEKITQQTDHDFDQGEGVSKE